MTRENPSITAFKAWIFPSLVSLLGIMIWQDVNEVKQDVKLLMAQSNIDKTRIDNLERQLYKSTTPALAVRIPNPPDKVPSQKIHFDMVAIKPKDDEHEEHKRKLLGYL